MKKLFLVFFLLTTILLVGLGCANSDVEKYNKEQEKMENQPQQPTKNNGDKGITVNEISYTSLKYDELPADLQAMANLEPKEGFTKVVTGKGDNKYVFISLGQRPTAGYDIIIKSIEDVEGKLTIVYSEKKPGKDEVVAQVISYPWKVIKIESPLPIGNIVKE